MFRVVNLRNESLPCRARSALKQLPDRSALMAAFQSHSTRWRDRNPELLPSQRGLRSVAVYVFKGEPSDVCWGFCEERPEPDLSSSILPMSRLFLTSFSQSRWDYFEEVRGIEGFE